MVIPISIKIPGYKNYQLDSQNDTGAMSSCYNYKVIPTYYWKPTKVHFKVVNKQLMKISYVAHDFPIYISSTIVYVTLYNYDTGSNILLGQYFVKRHMPMIVDKDQITFSVKVRKYLSLRQIHTLLEFLIIMWIQSLNLLNTC